MPTFLSDIEAGIGEFSGYLATEDTLACVAGLTVAGNSSGGGYIRLHEDTDNGNNYIAIRAPAALTGNTILLLPDGDGSANQVIKTDGAGNLFWEDSVAHAISGTTAGDVGPGADILYGISNETTTAGAIYVLRAGTWVLMNATLASTSRQLCAVAVGTNSSTDGMLIRGCVTLAAAIIGTDVEGKPIYASTTAGYAAIAPPTASGNGIRVLGYSLNVGSKKIFFDPDKTWLEI